MSFSLGSREVGDPNKPQPMNVGVSTTKATADSAHAEEVSPGGDSTACHLVDSGPVRPEREQSKSPALEESNGRRGRSSNALYSCPLLGWFARKCCVSSLVRPVRSILIPISPREMWKEEGSPGKLAVRP